MYHLLKGLHEYLTRSEPCLRLSQPHKATLSCYNSQEGRVFRHYYRPRRRGQVGALDTNRQIDPPLTPFRLHRLSSRRSRPCIMTRRAYHQTRLSRRWARTVRTARVPRLAASSLNVTYTYFLPLYSHSWEDISALSRAPILGSRRPTRDSIHLVKILR